MDTTGRARGGPLLEKSGASSLGVLGEGAARLPPGSKKSTKVDLCSTNTGAAALGRDRDLLPTWSAADNFFRHTETLNSLLRLAMRLNPHEELPAQLPEQTADILEREIAVMQSLNYRLLANAPVNVDAELHNITSGSITLDIDFVRLELVIPSPPSVSGGVAAALAAATAVKGGAFLGGTFFFPFSFTRE